MYHFRARAKNLAGFSDHSNMIYLQTSAPHAVGELLGSASTSKSVIKRPQYVLNVLTATILLLMTSSFRLVTSQFSVVTSLS